MKIEIFDPGKNKNIVAGLWDANTRTFIKKVTKKHYMIKEGGYGIQARLIDDLSWAGCVMIKIKTNKETYSLPFQTWYDNGTYKDYGHGEQCFYPVKFMTKEEK